jgi:hypothetical protein
MIFSHQEDPRRDTPSNSNQTLLYPKFSVQLCSLLLFSLSLSLFVFSVHARSETGPDITNSPSSSSSSRSSVPIEDIIPTTVANIKGHKAMYEDGWFIISSSQKALAFAKEHSINSSAEAINKATLSIKENTSGYTESLSDGIERAQNTSKVIFKEGTARSMDIIVGTHHLAQKEIAFSKTTAAEAWDSFITGYVYLGKRTEDSRAALKRIPSDFVDNVSEDFNELASAVKEMQARSTTDITGQWDNALANAEAEFKRGYEESGEKNDSITGLWTLLTGYAKGAYEGLFKPAAKSSWQTAKFTVKVAGAAVFLPVASTYILTKNTLQSSGMAIYYTGKTGIEVISPTLKGGYLASMSLLSAGAVPVTYVAGTTVGVINQVGSTVAAPVIGTTQGVVTTTADTLKYGTLVTYDALLGTTKVFVEQVKSGVVLGYNALTALPAHVLLGGINTAYFLVWDGPKLVVASVTGDVSFDSKTMQPGELPVGSVIDLKALQNNTDLNIQVISDDPEVIERVLESLPSDLKQSDLKQSDLKQIDLKQSEPQEKDLDKKKGIETK